MFHPFVIPFCIGVVALFTILGFKFFRWIKALDRRQRTVLRKHFLKGMFFPAIREMFFEGLLHRKVTGFSKRMGFMHRSIAFGWFLLIVVGFVETMVGLRGRMHPPWYAIFYRYFEYDQFTTTANVFANIMDALLLYVLIGVGMAVAKSLYAGFMGLRKTTSLKLFDLLLRYSLWLIFPLRLLSESLTACLYHNGGFLTQYFGDLFNPLFASVMELPAWTAYSMALGVFFTLLPFSRYMHIFAELLLIFFRKYGVREGEQPTGYTLMELSACSRCGICIENCPMDKVLGVDTIQPVYYLRDVRNKVPRRITAENCLMCNQCQSDCPVGLDLSALRRFGRDKQMLDTHDNYQYLEKVQAFNAIGRVAYFGGCMSHLTPGVVESMKKIFEAAGQKYWMMDEYQSICCGRPLMQQGFTKQAAELRRKNTNLIVDSHSKTLVTSCPICFQSFKNEYHLPVRVMHHTEYIAMLFQLGKLKVNPSDLRVAYHDPCELGRGCGIYEEPREVLRAVAQLVPVEKEGKGSICCGYNLGNTRLNLESQMLLREASWKNLTEHHPDVVATACPMCKKAFQHSSRHDVKDIAEIVAARLK